MDADVEMLNIGMNTFIDWLEAKEHDSAEDLAKALLGMKQFLGYEDLDIPAHELPKMVLKRCGYLESD